MRSVFLAFILLTGSVQAQIYHLFEMQRFVVPQNRIDQLVSNKQKEKGVIAAHAASDAVFIRRAFIDVTGSLPPVKIVKKFLSSDDPIKRELLIDSLLASDNFNHYWSLKWGDLLRIKSEFPINLWPNGVQAYHQWVYQGVKNNKPYDQFVRELLTSSGSNFRVPAVNFYRAIEGQKPESIAAAVALTFMGVRFETLSEQQQSDLTHIFSRVAYKKTTEWKEEIVYSNPASVGPQMITLPDGTQQRLKAGADPREAFAHWLIQPENPWFTKAISNRVWFWLMGRGIIHEPDDLNGGQINSNPELLTYLQQEFVKSGYDIRHLFRVILNSRTYQQSSIPQSESEWVDDYFAAYLVRRLDAEVLIDALNNISGSSESYQSPVPEPFTFVPETHKTIQLADGSISSSFLDKFGRPARDTGLESERHNQPSVDQAMYLLNSGNLQRKLSSSKKLKRLTQKVSKKNVNARLRGVYLLLLSRQPTQRELEVARRYIKKQGLGGVEDVIWAILNSKEFLFRH